MSPSLRFPEFTGEWEKCVLGDYGKVVTGNTPPTKDIENYENGTYLWASPADLGTHKLISETKTKLSSKGFTKTRPLSKGSVFVTCIGSTIGKTGMATREMSTNQQINSIVVNENNDNEFVYYVVQSAFPHYLSSIAVQAVPIISKSSFELLPSKRPSLQEQNKIGKFLSLLDERISTQHRLIEDLKKFKCAIVENVLNNRHPRMIRLGDIGSYIRGLTYSSNDVVEQNGTFIMRSNNIVNGCSLDYYNDVVSVNKRISKEQMLQNGDIIICMANGCSALVGKSSFYDGKCPRPITVGAFCGIYRSEEPIVKWLFQTNRYRRYIWNSLQGGNGAIANLNGEDILRMSFPIPDAPVKNNCVKLLTSVDFMIENATSLCVLYTSQKEYLLRQMFI
uniref:restriction endonuclease subunit S n=1 Tax=Candidatus Cryptobacteroides bacterium TaxID=3085639 RepID=UPI0040288C22